MKEMITQARPAVVRIDNGAGTGTGVIYDAQQQTAYIITNHHVTADAPRLTVTVNDAQTYTAKVLGADTQRDLALIAICCGDFHTLPFGDASQLQTGDEIIAIGYALALDGPATITRGIISAIRYAPEYQSDVIQTDAAINPGNSGGPMLSMDGEILGINTYILEQSGSGRPLEGLNFAISGTTVQQTIPALRRGQSRPTPAPTPTPAAGAQYTAFGPISGELWHNPANGHIETEYAQVNMADLLISATFINPYPASENSWDYGFILRRSGAGPDSRLIEIIVTGQGRWTAASRRGQPGDAQRNRARNPRLLRHRRRRTKHPLVRRPRPTRHLVRQRRIHRIPRPIRSRQPRRPSGNHRRLSRQRNRRRSNPVQGFPSHPANPNPRPPPRRTQASTRLHNPAPQRSADPATWPPKPISPTPPATTGTTAS